MNNDQEKDRGEFAPCPLPDREQRIQDGDLMNVMRQAAWDCATVVPEGDIRALKHRIHELEGELIGYKKIVADQDAMLERQTARIVGLQEHIENFDGEDR